VNVQASVSQMPAEMKRLVGLARTHRRKGSRNDKNFHESAIQKACTTEQSVLSVSQKSGDSFRDAIAKTMSGSWPLGLTCPKQTRR
jgi:hypothetical protein